MSLMGFIEINSDEALALALAALGLLEANVEGVFGMDLLRRSWAGE